MIFSKIEIIDGEQYVKIDLLAEELKQKDLLKKENQELKDIIYKAVEILNKIDFEDTTEYIPPKQIEPVYDLLKEIKNETK